MNKFHENGFIQRQRKAHIRTDLSRSMRKKPFWMIWDKKLAENCEIENSKKLEKEWKGICPSFKSHLSAFMCNWFHPFLQRGYWNWIYIELNNSFALSSTAYQVQFVYRKNTRKSSFSSNFRTLVFISCYLEKRIFHSMKHHCFSLTRVINFTVYDFFNIVRALTVSILLTSSSHDDGRWAREI